jgi:hypothetical protein
MKTNTLSVHRTISYEELIKSEIYDIGIIAYSCHDYSSVIQQAITGQEITYIGVYYRTQYQNRGIEVIASNLLGFSSCNMESDSIENQFIQLHKLVNSSTITHIYLSPLRQSDLPDDVREEFVSEFRSIIFNVWANKTTSVKQELLALFTEGKMCSNIELIETIINRLQNSTIGKEIHNDHHRTTDEVYTEESEEYDDPNNIEKSTLGRFDMMYRLCSIFRKSDSMMSKYVSSSDLHNYFDEAFQLELPIQSNGAARELTLRESTMDSYNVVSDIVKLFLDMMWTHPEFASNVIDRFNNNSSTQSSTHYIKQVSDLIDSWKHNNNSSSSSVINIDKLQYHLNILAGKKTSRSKVCKNAIVNNDEIILPSGKSLYLLPDLSHLSTEDIEAAIKYLASSDKSDTVDKLTAELSRRNSQCKEVKQSSLRHCSKLVQYYFDSPSLEVIDLSHTHYYYNYGCVNIKFKLQTSVSQPIVVHPSKLYLKINNKYRIDINRLLKDINTSYLPDVDHQVMGYLRNNKGYIMFSAISSN